MFFHTNTRMIALDFSLLEAMHISLLQAMFVLWFYLLIINPFHSCLHHVYNSKLQYLFRRNREVLITRLLFATVESTFISVLHFHSTCFSSFWNHVQGLLPCHSGNMGCTVMLQSCHKVTTFLIKKFHS